MRKKVALIVSLIAACSLFAACSDANVTENTVELKKDGKITEYTIEDFSESYYDAEELSSYIEQAVSDFSAGSEGEVKVTRQEVEDQTAYLTVKYDSVETFRAFSRVDCFSGTIAEAQAAGYDFDTDFIEPSSGTDAGESSALSETNVITATIPAQIALSNDTLKVFILGENASVIVPGKVVYASARNTRIVSDSMVSVRPDEGQGQNHQLIYVLYQ